MKKAVLTVIIVAVVVAVCLAYSSFFGAGNILDIQNGTYSNYYDADYSDNSATGSSPELNFDYSDARLPVSREKYYNYSLLNDVQKGMYDKIYNAIVTMQIGNVQLGNGTKRDAAIALYAVKYDNPQFFWLGYEYGLGISSDDSVFIRLDNGESKGYLYSDEERTAMMSELVSVVENIFSECVSDDMTDYEIELALHDWICNNIQYDNASGEIAADGERNDANKESWTAYGALVKRTAVCEGYSKAFQLLMYYAGINCNLICGETSDNSAHMWNIVEIDGAWYHVDALWDDIEESEFGPTHAFFNVTSDFVSKTHNFYPDSTAIQNDEQIFTAQYNLSIPVCVSDEKNYFVVNNTVINSDDEFYSVVCSAMKSAAENDIDAVEFIYSYKEINDNIISYDIKTNRIFSAVKIYYNDFNGLKYAAYSYGSFILKVSR